MNIIDTNYSCTKTPREERFQALKKVLSYANYNSTKKALKAKVKDVLAGYSVAMVTYFPMKMTTTRLSISEHLRDINLLHRLINNSYATLSRYIPWRIPLFHFYSNGIHTSSPME